jgi:hypothetical protein
MDEAGSKKGRGKKPMSKQIAIKFDDDIFAQLEQVAQIRGVTNTDAGRQLILDGLARYRYRLASERFRSLVSAVSAAVEDPVLSGIFYDNATRDALTIPRDMEVEKAATVTAAIHALDDLRRWKHPDDIAIVVGIADEAVRRGEYTIDREFLQRVASTREEEFEGVCVSQILTRVRERFSYFIDHDVLCLRLRQLGVEISSCPRDPENNSPTPTDEPQRRRSSRRRRGGPEATSGTRGRPQSERLSFVGVLGMCG